MYGKSYKVDLYDQFKGVKGLQTIFYFQVRRILVGFSKL